MFHFSVSYLPPTPLIHPYVPGERAPTPWPLSCKDNRMEAPSSSRWYFLIHGSAGTETGWYHLGHTHTSTHNPSPPLRVSLFKLCDSSPHRHIVLVCVFTCGTSILSVGRMVASLLLRGSNSKAAVNTMANPAGRIHSNINTYQYGQSESKGLILKHQSTAHYFSWSSNIVITPTLTVFHAWCVTV